MARASKKPAQCFRLWAFLHRKGVTPLQLKDLFKLSHVSVLDKLRNPWKFNIHELMYISAMSSTSMLKLVSLCVNRANFEQWYENEQNYTLLERDEVIDIEIPVPKVKIKKHVYKYSSKVPILPKDDKPLLE